MKKSTCSTGSQTEPEVVTVQMQTPNDSACQTEEMPAEKSVQTSTDAEKHTVKVGEEFEEFTKADKSAMAAIYNMVMLLHQYASKRIKQSDDYDEIVECFDKEAFKIICDRKYWSESEDDDADEKSSSQKQREEC